MKYVLLSTTKIATNLIQIKIISNIMVPVIFFKEIYKMLQELIMQCMIHSTKNIINLHMKKVSKCKPNSYVCVRIVRTQQRTCARTANNNYGK